MAYRCVVRAASIPQPGCACLLTPRKSQRRIPFMGTLYYGDNLEILRRYLKDETIDLVYLDPPFQFYAISTKITPVHSTMRRP